MPAALPVLCAARAASGGGVLYASLLLQVPSAHFLVSLLYPEVGRRPAAKATWLGAMSGEQEAALLNDLAQLKLAEVRLCSAQSIEGRGVVEAAAAGRRRRRQHKRARD